MSIINEELARRAKENCSFSDYKPGSATAEFNTEIERVKTLIEKAKCKVSPEAQGRLDKLFNSYIAKYANWINKRNANGAGHVSVMISGPANYNMRAHEKYLNRESKIWEEYEQLNNIEWKILSIVRGDKVIRSDDKNAVEKIKTKIKSLQGVPDPYGNKSAEIRRLKGRLLELAPEEFAEQQANITVNGAKTYEEIVALWDTGKIHQSQYDASNGRWYYDLLVDFTDGKRHYKELVSLEVDEAGANHVTFNTRKMETELIPLTDEHKYNLIISKISGSGNKAVIYQHLKSLTPKAQAAKVAEESNDSEAADTVTINGESAKVVRNKEAMRLQLMFDGKPEEKTREILKSNGFRWAPSNMAWQRLLNNNAEWSLKRIVEA
jgi:hypothetical protein